MPKNKNSVGIVNTKEKDRQTQVKATFALMNVLLENDWLTKQQIASKMKKKGFNRCERTITRLVNMLVSLKFNVLCNRTDTPFSYKANRKNPFL
jgi:hypothetical protein